MGKRPGRRRRSRLRRLLWIVPIVAAVAALAVLRFVHPGPAAEAPAARAAGVVEAVAAEARGAPARAASVPGTPLRLRVRVLARRPHDPEAFTQGLVWDGGSLYESTGLYGASSLREVDPESGRVVRRVDLPEHLFGEGLGLHGGRLVQLTWRAGRALVWERDTFAPLAELPYRGEGWGLCHDGTRWVMSDGSSRLAFRETGTFAEVGKVEVTLGGEPVAQLNELECAEGWIYANVLGSDAIVRIDGATGRVVATVDASELLPPGERRGLDALNGIAYDPERAVFLLTGKRWPALFEVVFEAE